MKRYNAWLKTRANHIIILFSIAFLVAVIGMLNLRFSTDFRVYLGADHPDVAQLDELENKFTKNETLFIAIRNSSGQRLGKQELTAVAELTDALWNTPHSRRVDSLTNFQYSYAQGDDIFVQDLFRTETESTQNTVDQLHQNASQEPLLKNFLYSADGVTAGIQVTLHMAESLRTRMGQTPKAVSFAREQIKLFEEKYPDLTFNLAGSVVMNQVMGEAAIQDILYLVPVCYALIIALMWFLFRNLWGVVFTMTVVTLANGFTLGLTGWTSPVLAPIVGFVPNAILVIAVASCIHLLIAMFRKLSEGETQAQAIESAVTQNLVPITLTMMTTVTGFLCLNFNESPPYRALGNMVALGTFFSYLLTMVLLPAVLFKLPALKGIQKPRLHTVLPKLAQHVLNHRVVYFVLGLFAIVPLTFLSTTNQLNDNWNNYFDRSFELRVDTDQINETLTGLHRLDFEVAAQEENGIYSPDYLVFLNRFTSWLRQQEEIRYVSGFSDTMARLNQNMHGDDPNYFRMPNSETLAAQYMLFYEMSLPYGLDMNHQVSFNKTSTRVTAILNKTSSEEVLATSAKISSWLTNNTPPTVTVSDATGLDVAFGNIARSNTQSMLWGTLLAFIIISALIALANRSIKYGLISLMPNVLPAVMAFGVWALTVNQVGLATSAVVAMAIGIIVDDTIHFISKYRYARHSLHLSVDDALIHSYATVGVAMTMSTIILAAGFFVLGLSPFEPTSHLGNLLGLTIVIALVFDLIFLPCAIALVDRNKPAKEPQVGGLNEAINLHRATQPSRQ